MVYPCEQAWRKGIELKHPLHKAQCPRLTRGAWRVTWGITVVKETLGRKKLVTFGLNMPLLTISVTVAWFPDKLPMFPVIALSMSVKGLTGVPGVFPLFHQLLQID